MPKQSARVKLTPIDRYAWRPVCPPAAVASRQGLLKSAAITGSRLGAQQVTSRAAADSAQARQRAANRQLTDRLLARWLTQDRDVAHEGAGATG